MPKTPPSSSTLLLQAWSYSEAMKELAPAMDPPSDRLAPPFFLLASFACELTLKAFCRDRGATDADVQRFKHDLKHALQAALEYGLRLSQPDKVQHLINLLQTPHKSLLLRYTPADLTVIMLPTAPAAVAAITALMDDVVGQAPSIAKFMPVEEE